MPIIVRNSPRTRTVVVGGATVAAIQQGQRSLTREDRRSVHTTEKPRTVEVGTRGLQGIQGADGTDVNALFVRPSGEAISALRCVKQVGGQLFKASGDVIGDAGQVIGVTVTATSGAGEDQTVRNDGRLIDASWNWSPGPVYCGANGVLIQNPGLATAFVCEVGRATDQTTLLIDIQPPLVRG